MPDTCKSRLNKYIAMCGICSRREADKLIEQGLVYVNGTKAQSGMQVCLGDEVILNGKRIKPANQTVVLAYNKAVGVTCTEKDKYAKTTIVEAVDYPERLTYAGRLDRDSDGLIIMTNDGMLINRMMKGANCHEKEYVVKTDREITDDFIFKMSSGVHLKELEQTTRRCSVEKIGKYTFKIILTQGLNRQIRRMCGELGYKVKTLTRVRIMNITLSGLETGKYRVIEGKELETLYEMCALEMRK